MVEPYECWSRDDGRDSSEVIDSRTPGFAAARWCESNWPHDASDGDVIEVVVRHDRTGELHVFSMQRTVEYEGYADISAAEAVAAELKERAEAESEAERG